MTPNDLLDIEAIKRVKYKYLRCLDQKLWGEITEVFTDDAVAAYSGGKYSFEGRDSIVDFLVRSMGADSFHSSHRVHQPEIDLVGGGRATGTWAMDDVVVMTDWNLTVRGAAFYEDEYRKVGDEWKISRTGYKRTYEEIQPRDTPGLKLTASWWSTGGVSELDAG
jgi:SnoaL-like domain